MAPGAKAERGPASDTGSSTATGTWGFEAEELSELLGAEELEEILSGFERGV